MYHVSLIVLIISSLLVAFIVSSLLITFGSVASTDDCPIVHSKVLSIDTMQRMHDLSSDYYNDTVVIEADGENNGIYTYSKTNNKWIRIEIFDKKIKGIVNIANFGVFGDGEIDDTLAIKKAIATLQDSEILFFPRGRYLINSIEPASENDVALTINNFKKVKIVGSGRGNTKIIDHFDGLGSGFINTSTILLKNNENITISGISFYSQAGFDGDKKVYTRSHAGIRVQGGEDIHIHHIEAENYGYVGGLLDANNGIFSRNVIVDYCNFSRNKIAGIMLLDTKNVTLEKNKFNNNGLHGNGGSGYGLAGGSEHTPTDITVRHNEASYNVRKGIDFHAGTSIKIHNNEVLYNGLYGIDVGYQSKGDISIYNNLIGNMNPTVTQITHGLDFIATPTDAQGVYAKYYNIICGIFIHFSGTNFDKHHIRIYGNRYKNFDGANPPNGVSQDFHPIFINTSGGKPKADFYIENNHFDVGLIYSFINVLDNSENGSNKNLTFLITGNKWEYDSAWYSELIMGLSSFKITNNILEKKGLPDSERSSTTVSKRSQVVN